MTEAEDPWGNEPQAKTETKRAMSAEEAALAESIYGAIQWYSTNTERSRQAEAFVIGVSDLGTCAERTRRRMAGVVEEPTDKFEAFIGQAVGRDVEAAIQQHYIREGEPVLTQAEVTVALEGDGGTYEFVGHPDTVHAWGVGDVKTSDGLSVAQRSGPSRQQLFQRHLNTLGAHHAGLLEVPLEEAKTYNVWVDRSGRTKEVFVHMDTFSSEIVAEATAWLDEVVYSYRQGIEAQKEMPRTWCEKACGFFQDCRMYDTDVEGLILDVDVASAVQLHQEAKELAKLADTMKRDATSVLSQVNGYVRGADGGHYQVRNTWVNPSEFQVTKKGYYRLNVVKIKPKV